MRFIIPQNYNFKSKAFGFIPYSTLLINIIWGLLIFSILHLLIDNWNIKIFAFVSLVFPITLVSIIGLNGEPFVYVLEYVSKYFFKPKVYLFKKY